jgi:hypothetical protein
LFGTLLTARGPPRSKALVQSTDESIKIAQLGFPDADVLPCSAYSAQLTCIKTAHQPDPGLGETLGDDGPLVGKQRTEVGSL